jgi:hypothetical protein
MESMRKGVGPQMASHPVTVVLSPLHRIPVIEACQSFFPTKQQSDINVRSTDPVGSVAANPVGSVAHTISYERL